MKDTQHIIKLANRLKNGGIIAYPTESVWGLGCDPFNETAVLRLLALKQRPIEKGVILVGADVAMVQSFISHLPNEVQQNMIHSWQTPNENSTCLQATTWLTPLTFKSETGCNPMSMNIPKWIVGKHASVAIRVTPHPKVQELCRQFGGLIVSTSCNPAGEEPATTLSQAKDYFGKQIDYLEAETLGYQSASKIIDALSNRVIRNG